MNLGTTGAIFTFAIEREAKIGSFYSKYTVLVNNSSLRDAFELLMKEHQKRDRLLNRFRRENVTEMILEPIHDFDSEPFDFEITAGDSPDDSSLHENAIRIEANSQSFFLKASEKTTFLPEVSDEFKRLSSKSEKHVSLLKSIS